MKGDAILLLLTMALGSGLAKAQVPTTMGKEFMVSFMNNGFRGCHSGNDAYDNLTLLVSAKNACSGTVTNPITGWTTAFDVGAYNITTIDIPQSVAYNSQADGIANTGLKVVSSDTISLYVANEFENSYDAANVLPIPTLGCQYMIQTFGTGTIANTCSENVRSSFMIIGTEANTTVEITPTTDTYGGHPAGTAYSITLNEGQCYHVMAASAGTDFSGTTINALDDKKIVVFNGNTITTVPINMSKGYDHVFEEAMPVDYWGTKFVVTTTKSTDAVPIESDYIRITALEDGTTVFKSGATLATLNSGESHQFVMQCASEAACYLESDKPVAVYLYQCSHQSDYEVYGDPSMVWISPVEQTMYDVTFSTLQVQQVETHYVNIVCYTDNLSSITLDSVSLASQFVLVPDNPLYSYAKVPLAHSTHILRGDHGFVAHVYGIGEEEGYAYSVGSSAKRLTKQMFIDDVLATSLPNGFIACQADELNFRTEVNYDYTRMEWNFGDNGTGSGAEVNHAYSDAGDYEVLSVVYKMAGGVETPFDSLTAMIHVKPVVTTTLDTTICGSSFMWNGVTYDEFGTYPFIFQSVYGCDSSFYLNLNFILQMDLNLQGLSQVSVATNSWPGSYNYYLDSTLVTGEVAWTISNDDWILIPKGMKCTLIVTTIDSAWLVAMVDDGDCHSVDSILINATYFGVDEYGPIDASVFPNPADDRLYIKAEGIVAVKLYDVMGQLVQRQSFDGDDLVTIDIHDCDATVYFVEVETQRGKTVKRVVVSRR